LPEPLKERGVGGASKYMAKKRKKPSKVKIYRLEDLKKYYSK